MSFPSIEFRPESSFDSTLARSYIDKILMPRIIKATKKGNCTMYFRQKPGQQTVKYGFTKVEKNPLEIINTYDPLVGKKLQLHVGYNFPDQKDIAAAFKDLGYDLLHMDEKCFIINWSKFMTAETITMTPENYIDKYLLPLINQAIKTRDNTIYFGQTSDHIVKYFPFKTVDVKHIINSIAVIGSISFQTENKFQVPTHAALAATFKFLGYDVLHVDDNCVIIKLLKLDTPTTSATTTVITTVTLNDFLYAVALKSLKKKDTVEIEFIYQTSPQGALCLTPPSSTFKDFRTDLNLLGDQRLIMGYEISYKYNIHKDFIIVMTFPVSAAKKMIANLPI